VITGEPGSTTTPAGQGFAAQRERSAVRRRVLKSGTIAFHQRFSSIPCVVRDLSSTGAHLRVEGTINVPNSFDLIVDLDGLEAGCEVVWRRNKEIGVRFVSPPRSVTPKRTQVVCALSPQQSPTLRRKPRA
jgi:hypothetical protein